MSVQVLNNIMARLNVSAIVSKQSAVELLKSLGVKMTGTTTSSSRKGTIKFFLTESDFNAALKALDKNIKTPPKPGSVSNKSGERYSKISWWVYKLDSEDFKSIRAEKDLPDMSVMKGKYSAKALKPLFTLELTDSLG